MSFLPGGGNLFGNNRRPDSRGYAEQDTPMNGAPGYDAPPRQSGFSSPHPPQRGLPSRPGGGREQMTSRPTPSQAPRGGSQSWVLSPTNAPDNNYTFRNLVAVSSSEIPHSSDGNDIYLIVNNQYVVSARPHDQFQRGMIGLSAPQRTWMNVALTDQVEVKIYDPFAQGDQAFLGSADIEVGFASQKKINPNPYDQDELAKAVTKVFQNQIFAPGQKFIMDLSSIPMVLTIKTVELMSLVSEKQSQGKTTSDARARGILTPQTNINFFRDPKSPINLKASTRRPAANSIIAPDFKFEDMGIGGLDTEFGTIFRRAFASRIFPPGLVEKLGIQHVKGILLFGPPGTGKTLIARQIGKMLNAREPKIINGPEVLNKYVGQSEENIRKLFADAEKEYKEKGDESGLHIIIFDELDAVCKQRGSGAGGGTGVGDSVVNQLLSKLDGVDQLNNILLIGMTNRMDMIDDALLRPGRLEVHMEISLPDEAGRQQILKIHTQKMRNNNVMDTDVDLEELAHLTKNFSGAEIGGLVKSATSFAFNRHVKVGTMAGVSDDVVNMKVNRSDFHSALDEVKPAFGVSEESLAERIHSGILHYSPYIKDVLEEGRLFVEQVRAKGNTPLLSVAIHGPTGAGKTALAAKIALDSGYPFIKLLSPEDLVGMGEGAKIQQISKLFMDAYKSTYSCLVIDSIEEIIEWVPIGPRFSNPILQTLITLLHKRPPAGRKLLIFATTSEKSTLQQLNMWQKFNFDISVPNIKTYDELAHVMEESQAFSSKDIKRSIAEIQDITRSETVGVGIKTVLLSIESAKNDPDVSTRFAGAMCKAIAEGTSRD